MSRSLSIENIYSAIEQRKGEFVRDLTNLVAQLHLPGAMCHLG